MKTVCVPVGCRSDAGLSAPIIKRLKESDWCDVQVVQLEPQDFIPSYQIMDCICKGHRHIGNHNAKKPDLVLIVGDRVEMCAAAAAAFHNQVKIAHYGAGIVNDPITTYDDVDRHCITLWSDICFTEGCEATSQATALLYGIKYPEVFEVGIPHLDDLEIDESLVPDESYALFLRNAEPLNKDGVYTIPWGGKLLIQIGGNPDGKVRNHSEVHPYPAEAQRVIYYQNLPRPRFLGLLKNCQRFLTNSSAAYYEAPHFLKPEQIIMVGDRNKNRPRGPFQTGASDKIVEILKDYLT
jgi:GDP/UDP-N,N'-diacetylbacillosamine 2-epimerase (hydrolysing)